MALWEGCCRGGEAGISGTSWFLWLVLVGRTVAMRLWPGPPRPQTPLSMLDEALKEWCETVVPRIGFPKGKCPMAEYLSRFLAAAPPHHTHYKAAHVSLIILRHTNQMSLMKTPPSSLLSGLCRHAMLDKTALWLTCFHAPQRCALVTCCMGRWQPPKFA